MATQGIELMERLKDTHGDESVLDFKIIPLGLLCSEGPLHVPLDKVFTLGQTQPLSLNNLDHRWMFQNYSPCSVSFNCSISS